MSGISKLYWAAEGTLNGNPLRAKGSLKAPVKEVLLTGNEVYDRTIVVPRLASAPPQPDPTLLWRYEDMEEFDHAVFVPRDGHGYLRLAWLCDKPVSSSDLSAAGTHQDVNHAELNCTGPFILTTDEATVFPNAMRSTSHALDGNGFPNILTDTTNGARGRIYAVWCVNTATDADVPVDVYMRG